MSFKGKYSVIAYDENKDKKHKNIKFSTIDEALKEGKKLAVHSALEFIREHEKDYQFLPCFDNVDEEKVNIYEFIPYDELIKNHEDKFKYGVIIMESETNPSNYIKSYEILKIETTTERSFTSMFFSYTVKKVKLLKLIEIKENLATHKEFLNELHEFFKDKRVGIEDLSTTEVKEEK